MSDEQNQQKNTPPLIHDRIQTLFSDLLEVNMRTDGSGLLRFMSLIPEGKVEQVRILVSASTLHSMAELFCRLTGYVPNTEKKNTESSSNVPNLV
jgi:hypothetical protein